MLSAVSVSIQVMCLEEELFICSSVSDTNFSELLFFYRSLWNNHFTLPLLVLRYHFPGQFFMHYINPDLHPTQEKGGFKWHSSGTGCPELS